MKHQTVFGVSVVGFLLGAAMSVPARSESLSEFRWKNRVLVVAAPSTTDSNLLAQRRIFQQASDGMAERDVIMVEAAGDDDRARGIRAQLSIKGDFRAVLVGKDGNAAFRWRSR